MRNDLIRVLDLDGSVTCQKRLLAAACPAIIPLADLGPDARVWANRRTIARLTDRLTGSPIDAVTFLGSGDFHHLTHILTATPRDPFTLIVFDRHPDWDIVSPWLSCGAWVRFAARNPLVTKIILVGVSAEEINSVSILGGDLASLENDRIELYPYLAKPTAVALRRVPDNISLGLERAGALTRIFWLELKNRNVFELVLHILQRLPTKEVYLSIDKDCLKARYALTNWEEGMFELDELLMILKTVREHCRIVGADICGDYSPARERGLFKKVISLLDHPRRLKAERVPRADVHALNEETNLRLLAALTA